MADRKSGEMRLREPRVSRVQNDDGSAVLLYEGVDTTHDLGGGKYRLLLRHVGLEVEFNARVHDATYAKANSDAAKNGIDLHALSSLERLAYHEQFADTHGRRSEVLLFGDIKGGALNSRLIVRDFCKLFLEIDGSFKYNHPDYPSSGDGYYPDEIYFCPYDVDRTLYMTVRAGVTVTGAVTPKLTQPRP